MNQSNDLDQLKKLSSQIRRDIVRMVHACQSGHPGGSLGCTDFFVALYFKFMKHDPKFNMEAAGEDLFFLSNGHISPVFYSTLARAGYFDVKELTTFRMLNSRLQGHPATHEHLPGIRIALASMSWARKILMLSPYVLTLPDHLRWTRSKRISQRGFSRWVSPKRT